MRVYVLSLFLDGQGHTARNRTAADPSVHRRHDGHAGVFCGPPETIVIGDDKIELGGEDPRCSEMDSVKRAKPTIGLIHCPVDHVIIDRNIRESEQQLVRVRQQRGHGSHHGSRQAPVSLMEPVMKSGRPSALTGLDRPTGPHHADRTRNTRAVVGTVAIRVLGVGQVLLVVVLGEVEVARGHDLGADLPVARFR